MDDVFTGFNSPSYWENLAAYNQSQGLAKPARPEWETLLGEDGRLQEPYQLSNQLNNGAIDALRTEGLRAPGEQSQFRQIQGQQLNEQAGQAAASSQNNTNTARNQLASTGGLRSGASERLAQRGARNADLARQDVLSQRTALDVGDEQNRLNSLGTLNQAELANGQFNQEVDQFNITNSLNENLQKRASDTNNYNEDIRAWAARQTAEATPSGGGGKK